MSKGRAAVGDTRDRGLETLLLLLLAGRLHSAVGLLLAGRHPFLNRQVGRLVSLWSTLFLVDARYYLEHFRLLGLLALFSEYALLGVLVLEEEGDVVLVDGELGVS